MPNTNLTTFAQSNFNFSDHDANAISAANSGNNVVAGLVAVNAANPATSTAAAVNLSPVTQSNAALDTDAIFDPDVIDIF